MEDPSSPQRPRPLQRRPRGDRGRSGGFPIACLLPVPSPSPGRDKEDDDIATTTVPRGRRDEDADADAAALDMYPQAVALLGPQSTAAARTIGKIVDNRQVAQRILQRHLQQLPVATAPDLPSGDAGSGKSRRRVELNLACEAMFLSFDPQTQHTRSLPRPRMPLLLAHFGLEVDDIRYRQWEQSLPAMTSKITLLQFIAACVQWFGEQGLLDRYAAWRARHQPSLGVRDTAANGDALARSHSAPQLLHPFDKLTRRQDEASMFSYEDHARDASPGKRLTTNEHIAMKSEAILRATHEFRRQAKIQQKLDSGASTSTLTALAQHPTSGSPLPQHDRLHSEKLARHILQRCSTQALAPSNRHAGGSIGSSPQKLQRGHVQARRQRRQQDMESARAFSSSIAMISRHVHNEELRDVRELEHEKQINLVDSRKELRRLQRAHCQALTQDKVLQQMREVLAMKVVAREEGEMVNEFRVRRQELLRTAKPVFSLSSSTSTIFQQPPEILAAKATAKTGKQLRTLQNMEKEHLEHMRSIQLLDYVRDKRLAVANAREPKADAALQDLQVENLPEAQELSLATEELWTQLVEDCCARQDFSALLPPPNSPPAALRYFGTSRPVYLPPFTSSTVTPSPVSKVP